MKQVAAALKAAADAGIVHRDVKPENIMLTRSDDAKVTDFGLAQLNEPTQQMNLTQAGTTMGTPWYMSPEQIQGEPLDHRTDQYAFGVTCYHMFAGEPPFPGKNSVSVAVQHLKDEPTPLATHRRDLPVALCDMIHRMMAKKPGDRFATPEELQQALNSLDGAAINPDIIDTSSFSGWLRSSLPSAKMLWGGLLICAILGAMAGRRLFQPITLELKPSDFPRQESAARQYAAAMLQPTNTSWQAVYDHYPNSDEALWARLQLGVYYLTRPIPNFNKADEAFQKLTQEASRETEQTKRNLTFLALLGRALCAERQIDELQSQTDGAERPESHRKKQAALEEHLHDLVYNRLMTARYKQEMDLGSIEAPGILQDYYEGLRVQAGLQPSG